MKGSKCKLWHKGEPTNQERGTKTYLLRKSVTRHEQNQLSPRIAASRRKRNNNQPAKTKESNANKQSEETEIEFNESIWVPQSNSKERCDFESSTTTSSDDSCTFKYSTPNGMNNTLTRDIKEAEDRLNALRPRYEQQQDEFQRTGLRNLGNSCYINSIIQSLVSTELLISRLAPTSRKQSFKLNGMSNELLFLSKELKSGKCGVISPTNFRRELIRANSEFDNKNQQDAHEAKLCVLDNMHQELKSKCSDGGKTIIEDTFDGKFEMKTKCIGMQE